MTDGDSIQYRTREVYAYLPTLLSVRHWRWVWLAWYEVDEELDPRGGGAMGETPDWAVVARRPLT